MEMRRRAALHSGELGVKISSLNSVCLAVDHIVAQEGEQRSESVAIDTSADGVIKAPVKACQPL